MLAYVRYFTIVKIDQKNTFFLSAYFLCLGRELDGFGISF